MVLINAKVTMIAKQPIMPVKVMDPAREKVL
jgi:hypothetical protein